MARISGDEFAIILHKIKGKKDAAVVTKKIIKIFSKPFNIEKHKLSIGVSIGISLQRPDDEGVSEKKLLNNSDTAMYYVKEQGKNNFKFFEG